MHLLLLETIALIGATVHTMEPGPAPGGVAAASPAIVLIEDGLIVAVGPDVEVPADAERIELSGLHLVPGLTDAFCSYDREHDALWLAAGITTVRDGHLSAGDGQMEKLVSLSNPRIAPQLLVSSPTFMGATGKRPNGFRLGAPEQAAEQLAEIMERLKAVNGSFDYFSHDGTVDEGQLRVVCQTGLENGIETWGRLPAGIGVRAARAAGQSCLLGLDSLLPQGARFSSLSEEQLAALDAAVSDLAAGGWKVAPTLMGTGRIVRSSGPEDPAVLDALGPADVAVWQGDLEVFRVLKGQDWPAVLATVEAERSVVRKLHAAGVQLVPASGAPSAGIAPGGGLIDELEEWVAAGIPAAEVLALATRGAAEALGGAVPSGRIAPGHAANLLALSSDPCRSISALRTPEVMVLRGQVREGFELEEAVTELVAARDAARAERERPVQLDPPPMPPGEVVAAGQLEVTLYGARYSVERYAVTKMARERFAYGARIRIPSAPGIPTREIVMVQVIHEGLVEFFDFTMDVLDEDGAPRLKEGQSAFFAAGRPIGTTKRLSLEIASFGQRLSSSKAEEPLAAVRGSMALLALIAAQHFPDGPSFVLEFEELVMEPLVDRLTLTVDPVLSRMNLAGQRSVDTFGLDAGGKVLFAAKANTQATLVAKPVQGPGVVEVSALSVRPERVYKGDPASWANDAFPQAASASTPEQTPARGADTVEPPAADPPAGGGGK